MHVANPMIIALWWDAQLARWAVWGGLVLLTVALLLLIRTRWGQQPLGKCVVLSLLAHLLLAIYMTTVNIVTAPVDSPNTGGVHVALVAGSSDEPLDEAFSPERWNAIAPATVTPLDVVDLSPTTEVPPLGEVAEPKRVLPEEPAVSTLTNLPERPTTDEAPAPELVARDEPLVRPRPRPEPTELPTEDAESPDLVPPPERPAEPLVPPPDNNPRGDATETPRPSGESGSAQSGELAGKQSNEQVPVPKIYQGRTGNHLGPTANGATKETEAAVRASLRWLAANQDSNGRWDPRRLEAGTGRAADGEERQSAGAHADTGLTGLALLTFLASGHTHLQGAYRDNVRRGLEFLLASQDATGNLGATDNLYERMYCHAMACCALSEAYAMTRDQRILPALRSAIQYTIRMQDRASGSWRYQIGQPGDTSQLGWQVMALKSAELGGLAIPRETRSNMERFLRSVASGRSGGLACYQPTRPIATRSMTAEALACRQFLGVDDRPETVGEACEFLLRETPGTGHSNHYYWYYATLALHQAGGEPWRRWNESLQNTLLASQRLDGSWAGSWDPDPVWGRCGGRVYSTSLCTLCLEVYYRYLPLYVETAGRTSTAVNR